MTPPNALDALRDRAEDFVNMVSKGHSICLCAACKPVVIEMLMDSLAEIRREEAQWWADEQVEKDGELSARGAIRLAEIDAAAPPAVTRDKPDA